MGPVQRASGKVGESVEPTKPVSLGRARCRVCSEHGLQVGLLVPSDVGSAPLQFFSPDGRLLQAQAEVAPGPGEALAVTIPGRLLEVELPPGRKGGDFVAFEVPGPPRCETVHHDPVPGDHDGAESLPSAVECNSFDLIAPVPMDVQEDKFQLLVPPTEARENELLAFVTSKQLKTELLAWRAPQPDPSGHLRGQTFQGRRGSTNYLLRGQRDGPLVVCLHGLMGSLSTFEPVASRLLTHFQVLTFDLYGYGLSVLPSERFNEDLFVDQLLELVSGLGFNDNFFVIGYSVGGVVAMNLALKHPDKIRSLLLVAPAGLLPLSSWEHAGVVALRGCQSLHLPVTAMAGALAQWFMQPDHLDLEPDVQHPEDYKACTKLNAQRLMSDPAKYTKAWLKTVRDMDISGREAAWASLDATVPVALIWGEDDCVVPLDICCEALSRCLPRAPVVRVRDAGHALFLERQDDMTQYIFQWFLEGRCAGRPAAKLWRRPVEANPGDTPEALPLSPLSSEASNGWDTPPVYSEGAAQRVRPCVSEEVGSPGTSGLFMRI